MSHNEQFKALKNDFISKSEKLLQEIKQIEMENLSEVGMKFKIAALRNDAGRSYTNLIEFIAEVKTRI